MYFYIINLWQFRLFVQQTGTLCQTANLLSTFSLQVAPAF